MSASAREVVNTVAEDFQELQPSLAKTHLKIAPFGSSFKAAQNDARRQQRIYSIAISRCLEFQRQPCQDGYKTVGTGATEAKQFGKAETRETAGGLVKVCRRDEQRANGELR